MTCALDRLDWLRLALEESPTAAVVVDASGTIVLVNAELLRLFRYTREELVGRPAEVLLPGAVWPIQADQRPQYAAVPGAESMGAGRALTGRTKDGVDVPIEVGPNPIPCDDGVLAVLSIIDITERLRREGLLRAELEDQLAFERLLATFSLRCINLPEEQMPGQIRGVLETLGVRLGLERCWFARFGGDDSILDPVIWTSPAVPPVELPPALTELFPWSIAELRAGRTVSFANRDDLPDERDRAGFALVGVRSAVYVPILVDGAVAAATGFASLTRSRAWPAADVERLSVIARAFGQALTMRAREAALRSAHQEVQRLKDQLHAENVYLRREERERLGVTRIVGQSAAIARVLEQVGQVAATDSTVLLLGETGTGKEVFATHIHELSERRGRAMVRVNCGAIPSTLIESELFGREKGAFTGALARQIGRFELANQSTIFLDEIGDLPPEVQVKLLRVLEERTIDRLGSPRSIPIDTRIIAATHRNLEQRAQEGLFREDLYYRLNVFPIHVPPLRERGDDILLLVWRFVEEFSKAFGKRIDSIETDSLAALQQHPWPGNVRELRNTVERAMIVAASRRLSIPLPQSSTTLPRRSTKLAEVERDHIRTILESTRWRIRGAGGAADRLGLKPTTLETRMAKLGIQRPRNA